MIPNGFLPTKAFQNGLNSHTTTTGGFRNIYTVGTLNPDFDKNMLLLKNPQYLPDHYETLTQ